MNCLFRRSVARVVVARTMAAPCRQTLSLRSRPFSSAAVAMHGEEDYSSLSSSREKHCETCTCDSGDAHNHENNETQQQDDATTATHPCGQSRDNQEELPPPLPEPTYSVHKRVMPENLIALSSKQGRSMLLEALSSHTAESYWSLMEHFTNQSDPAYCGVTTLLIVLNSFGVDPNIRWRGGWRYYGDEDVLLGTCCIPHERIRRAGITLTEFARLAKCQGLDVTMKQPTTSTIKEFRENIQTILSSEDGTVVASFSRSALGQTGEGHFSPIAAYHEETDRVLVLDVARFKYAPYWVSISELYEAMALLDETTQEPRGWFVLRPPPFPIRTNGEARRPAHLVPEATQSDICPVGKVKVNYCEVATPQSPNKTKR